MFVRPTRRPSPGTVALGSQRLGRAADTAPLIPQVVRCVRTPVLPTSPSRTPLAAQVSPRTTRRQQGCPYRRLVPPSLVPRSPPLDWAAGAPTGAAGAPSLAAPAWPAARPYTRSLPPAARVGRAGGASSYLLSS